ncbi:MAG: hypothetical protein AAB668_01180 [Patescibacteria group bacterium]
MSTDAPLKTVVIALHMMDQDLIPLIMRLGYDPVTMPTRDASWGFIANSDEEVRVVFGRAGLKRVYAPLLIQQLTAHGFKQQGCILARKPDTYTKKEARIAKCEGLLNVREGRPKFGPAKQYLWKQCLEVRFRPGNAAPVRGDRLLLRSMFEHICWKRGRVYEITESDGRRYALVELVMPFRRRRIIWPTNLIFVGNRFQARQISHLQF